MPKRKDEGRPRLSPERQELVDEIVRNLESGAGLWVKGWDSPAPASLATGRPYRGANNLYLSYVAGKRGYDDNRWVTFAQIEREGWSFKKDAEGNSLGRGASVPVDFYEFRDRATKRPYDSAVTDGMSAAERGEYLDKNVYLVRRTFRVFNASVVDGVPERDAWRVPGERNERIERLISYWDAHESKITYGGDTACYSAYSDEIQLPPRAAFRSLREYYSTALHEMGHATGHSSRLDRHLARAGRDSEEYAREEIRAELGSVFMEQDFTADPIKGHVWNNAAYIGTWIKALKDDPSEFYRAVADAEKISRYVSERSAEADKEFRAAGVECAEAPPAAREKIRDAAPETLRLSDRELVERCARAKTGDVFTRLYEGRSGFRADKAAGFLCLRLAAYTDDEERIGRILRSSAVYDEDRGEDVYAAVIADSVARMREISARAAAKTAGKAARGKGPSGEGKDGPGRR